MRANFNAATRRNIGLSGAALALCLSLTGQAAAQETEGEDAQDNVGVAEIVVTAQKRSENLQDVPISITAVTSDALEDRCVHRLAPLSLGRVEGDEARTPLIYAASCAKCSDDGQPANRNGNGGTFAFTPLVKVLG